MKGTITLAAAALLLGGPWSGGPVAAEPHREARSFVPPARFTAPIPRLETRRDASDAHGARGSRKGPRRGPRAGFRAADGSGNHPHQPAWGAADTPLLRLTAVDYGDGAGAPAGAERPSPRAVSNAVAAQVGSTENARGASDMVWQWGQFLDHDIDETPGLDPPEPFPIPVPPGDAWFDPGATGSEVIGLNRSLYVEVDGVRQQVNAITAYIDASNVYGSDEARASALRTLDGSGRLRTGNGDLLPDNEPGLPNAPSPGPAYFLAGDVRANEQVGLTALHTVFVREHNFWADAFRAAHPDLDGETVYQLARMVVAAEMQAITYNEFLPLLLGRHALPRYRGFRPGVDPGIANVFSTAAYRVGHTMLSATLLRLDRHGEPIPAGHLALADAFFAPDEIRAFGVAPVLRGLAAQPCQEVDNRVVDAVRNFLFGPPGGGGFDLAALNIQRGRDHGLPGYNQVRRDLGLPARADFAGIHPDPAVHEPLASVYESVEAVDAWVGMLAEPHRPGAMVGETVHAILVDQFTRLRDGDRFWYRRYLSRPWVRLVERQTLARIIRRNTEIGDEIPDDVFRIGGASNGHGIHR